MLYFKMKIFFSLVLICVFIDDAVVQFMECEKNIWHICYEDSSYPADEIAQKWNNINMNTQKTFGKLMERHAEKQDTFEPCKLCETALSMRIQPVSLIEPDEKVYLINTANYPRPEIEIQTCKSGAKCRIDGLQNDFKTSCVQKKSRINVLVFNSTSREFQGIPLTYPSACECIVVED